MKNIFLSLLLFVVLSPLNAQKLYSTKSGQISFNATGESVKIMGLNNQVDSKFAELSGQIIFGVDF